MSSPIVTSQDVCPAVHNGVCRLCQMECSDFQKCISPENSDMDAVYRITLKYFPATFLEPRLEFLCWECWRHIMDFNGFQEVIFDIQRRLIQHVDEKIPDMSSCTNTDDNGFFIKPNVYNRETPPEEQHSNENCQNAAKVTNDINKEEQKSHAVPDVNELQSFLSDLEDIDIQYSTDDEMPVAGNPAIIVKDNPITTTSYCISAKDNANGDVKAPSKRIAIEQRIRKYMPKLSCWLCGSSFLNFERLTAHFRECHTLRQCYISCCGDKFPSQKLLWKHICRFHKAIEKFLCYYCKENFLTKKALRIHKKKSHHFRCSKCSHIARSRNKLKKHFHVHLVCLKCKTYFQNINELRSHDIMVHSKNNNETSKPVKRLQSTYSCKACKKCMDSKTLYDNHMRYAHNEENMYKCKTCEKAFKKVLHLRDHMNTHTSDNYYDCPLCPKKLQFWCFIEPHMKAEHGKEFTIEDIAQSLLKEETESTTIYNF